MRKYLSFTLLACLLFIAIGCGGGGRGSLTFDGLKHPASMSAFLYDKDNKTAAKDKELTVLDKFSYEKKFWGLLYSTIPLSSDKDVVEAINKKVEEAGGDGIINLSVTASNCAFNSFPILSLLPIMPGCVNAVVEGEIVKLKARGSSQLDVPNDLSTSSMVQFIPKGNIGEAITNLTSQN